MTWYMHVRNFLDTVRSCIRDQAVTIAASVLGSAGLTTDLPDCPGEIRNLLVGRFSGKVIEIHVGSLRYHEHMNGRPGGNVVECKAVAGFIHLVAWNLAPEDLGENIRVVVFVGHASLLIVRIVHPADAVIPAAGASRDSI